jgi:hypothetical protein
MTLDVLLMYYYYYFSEVSAITFSSCLFVFSFSCSILHAFLHLALHPCPHCFYCSFVQYLSTYESKRDSVVYHYFLNLTFFACSVPTFILLLSSLLLLFIYLFIYLIFQVIQIQVRNHRIWNVSMKNHIKSKLSEIAEACQDR